MKRILFTSDVHLGLDVNDPKGREKRFADFLLSIKPQDTQALYLLGDIFDFWYEYRDVVPKGYVKVLAALQGLVEQGVEVYFFEGNHDVWTYSYLQSLGLVKLCQPYRMEIAGKTFCIGHGDALGPTTAGVRIINAIFHCKPLQKLFNCLHPWIAFRLGNNWSKHNRVSRGGKYEFKGPEEPLAIFAEQYAAKNPGVDYFIFGHLHTKADLALKCGAHLIIMDSWFEDSPYLSFDGTSLTCGTCIGLPNIEK